jgi:hypothetical protein
MALFRNVGAPTTLAAGKAVTWEYSWGTGQDVGVTMVTPNLLEPSINIPLICSDFGVVLRQGQGENPPGTNYFVTIRNTGEFPMMHNLNVGDLL